MTRPLENLNSQTAGVLLADAYKRFYLYSETQSGEKPTLLLAFPPAWHNRYQVLLYKKAVEHGILTFGVKDLNVLEQISWPGQIIIHFHWFQDLFQKCSDEIEAIEQLWSIKQRVINFRNRTDAKLIWTAHNILPHKNNFPETFLELRKWVFNEFDGLHIMNESHQSLLEQTFETKFRGETFIVPHPLYESGKSP